MEFLGEDKVNTFKNEVGFMETDIGRAVSDADVILFFITQNFACHSEAIDRNSIELDPNMEYAMRACRRVNKNIVTVLNVGDAVSTYKWNYCA